MRGLWCLVLPALAGAANPLYLNITWYNCSLYTTANETVVLKKVNPDAECADVSLPLCHTDICNSTQTISIFIKRLVPDSDTYVGSIAAPPRAMWMLQGGPGHPSSDLERSMKDVFDAANGTMTIYTMDHRGTGRSTLLDCKKTIPSAQDLATCFATIKSTYGDHAPVAFSVTSAAMDLKLLVDAVQTTADVYVYGVSYGTYLVERLMHLSPNASHVKGYILDSLQSERFTDTVAPFFSNWDRDVAGIGTSAPRRVSSCLVLSRLTRELVDRFFAVCNRDAFCAAKIGPDARQTLVRAFEALDANTSACSAVLRAAATKGGYATPSGVVRQLLYNWFGLRTTRVLIPAYIYRLQRCSRDDVAWLQRLSVPPALTDPEEGDDARGPYMGKSSGISSLVYDNIVFNELWQAPSPSVETLYHDSVQALFSAGNLPWAKNKLMKYCAFTQNVDASVCAGRPRLNASFMYAKDLRYWNKTAAIPTGASVLMLSGGLDQATPPQYAAEENATMVGRNKLLLTFPHTNHGILQNTPLESDASESCGVAIIASFVVANGDLTRVNTSCIPYVETLNFSDWDADLVVQLFDSASPYEMIRATPLQVSTTSTSIKARFDQYGWLVVLSSLLGIAGVAMMGMARRIRHLERHANEGAAVEATSEKPHVEEEETQDNLPVEDDATVIV
ncbi:Aste57867_2836 [Aphanomyces stellatus]|uniref:Aste57867_2836 protein n=1 Tax=Aphanomyces stellatus TaxID=120398 RepID=A0A485KDM9_9STRA|nr:hypothetical protein As57867_002828 [Aphanomyces stellatus]VFT80024.1 Aste57867_2836 [Aphanomyces stellatus]